MPKYRYLVINEEHKQLSGTIGAPDEKSAREELNELGLSIISIEKIEEDADSDANRRGIFEFSGIDKNKKRIIGTIESIDRYEAYKRLTKEYNFAVEYIVDNSQTPENREQERKKGIEDLQDILNEETTLLEKNIGSDEKDIQELGEKQTILKSQIDFVLNKVKEILDLYEKDLKPETKEKIRRYVEKILRIKSSTNLDYVRKTVEELLTFLQKEELFLYQETKMQERTKMLLDAKSMMMQLRQTKKNPGLSFIEKMDIWRKKHIQEKENPNIFAKAVNLLLIPFLGPVLQSNEIIQTKHDIKLLNQQLKQYILLYFQAPNSEFKKETKTSLKKLWNERKNLKLSLKNLQKENQNQQGKNVEIHRGKYAEFLNSFTGWILTFYLIYYFVGLYATNKDFGFKEVPDILYIFRSFILKYFFVTIFFLHASLSVKLHFFKKNEVAAIVITPLFLIIILIIYLNF